MSSVALLFARDPFKHSDQDIDEIIEYLRAKRLTIENAAPAKKAAAPKAKRVTKGQKRVEGLDIEIEL